MTRTSSSRATSSSRTCRPRWPIGCRVRRRSATPRRSCTSTAVRSVGKLPRPPKPSTARAMMEFAEAMQQGGEGASKGAVRLEHLDDQGVWGEVVYPSLGLWYGQIDDPHLVSEAAKVLNDHVHDELIRTSPRFVPTATLPLQSVELSIEGGAALRRPRLPCHLPAHRACEDRSVLERRPLGTAVVGDRGGRSRHRRAHRHRRRRQPPVPEPGRRAAQLSRHHVRRSEGGGAVRGRWRARAASRRCGC